MNRFRVTICQIITDNNKRVFTVSAPDIVSAQVRVLSRVQAITRSGMFYCPFAEKVILEVQ